MKSPPEYMALKHACFPAAGSFKQNNRASLDPRPPDDLVAKTNTDVGMVMQLIVRFV
jgi:hypothetical protein